MGLEDFAALKRKWRVSMQSLICRAHELNAIDPARYTSLFAQLSRKGWRKTEPIAVAGETPTAFTQLLRKHLEAGYTLSQLAELLFVEEGWVQTMLRDADSPTWERDGVRMRLVN
jgi:Zn-dependent peptidase ImmA (M78 family)